MDTLQRRMQELRRERPDITNTQLARAAGVRMPSVSGWFSGTTSSLKYSSAHAVAELYGVNAEWVATGRGPKRASGSGQTQGSTTPSAEQAFDALVRSMQTLKPEKVRRLLDAMAAYIEDPEGEALEREHVIRVLSGEGLTHKHYPAMKSRAA